MPTALTAFCSRRKDRSIFRKNIGRCLLNKNQDPFLQDWERDLTTRAAREEWGDKLDSSKQAEIENQVSQYMRSRMRVAVIEVPEKEQRLLLESRITSTVSLCEECGPSEDWLGQHSPKNKIFRSGLWQVNELYKTPFSEKELASLFDLLPPLPNDRKFDFREQQGGSRETARPNRRTEHLLNFQVPMEK